MIASRTVNGRLEEILPGLITAPVTKTGKEEDSTVISTSGDVNWEAYSAVNAFFNSPGVNPAAFVSPISGSAILPSRLIVAVVLRLGAPGKEIFKTSPSRNTTASERLVI